MGRELLSERQGVIDVSSGIYEMFNQLLLKENHRSKIILREFVVKIQSKFGLSADNLMRQLNIIAVKICKKGSGFEYQNIRPVLEEISIILDSIKCHEEVFDKKTLVILLNFALSQRLVSNEISSDSRLHHISLVNLTERITQVIGVISQKNMESVQMCLGGEKDTHFLYFDGAGRPEENLQIIDLYKEKWPVYETPYGVSVNIDHHQKNNIELPSTVEMLLTELSLYLRCEIFEENTHVFDQAANWAAEFHKLSHKLQLSFSPSVPIEAIESLFEYYKYIEASNFVNVETGIIEKIILKPESFQILINLPDPDSIAPISLVKIIEFWKNLFGNTEFKKIPIDDIESKKEFIRNTYKQTFLKSTQIEILDLLNTGLLNQYCDLKIEILTKELNQDEPKTIIKDQLAIILKSNYPDLAISDYDFDILVELFGDIKYELKIEECYEKFSLHNSLHANKSNIYQRLGEEKIEAIFDRLYEYNLRSKEIIKIARDSIAQAEKKREELLNSELFQDTLDQMGEVYENAYISCKKLGNFDQNTLYHFALEAIFSRIEDIVRVVSNVDARCGIMSYMDFEGRVELPELLAKYPDYEITDYSPFGSLAQLFDKNESLEIINVKKTQLLSLICSAVANHVHTNLMDLMNLYREGEFIQSHAVFNTNVYTVISLLLAFRNNPDKFVKTVQGFNPLKSFEINKNEYFRIYTSPFSRHQIVSYKQSDEPKELNRMGRSLLKITRNPGLYVILMGINPDSKVGLFNYTIALSENHHAGLMKAIVNFISIFTETRFGQFSLDNINDFLESVSLHSGSDNGSTGFRLIGIPFGQLEMEKFLNLFLHYYSLVEYRKTLESNNAQNNYKFNNSKIVLDAAIISLVNWCNEAAAKMKNPNYYI